MYFGAKTSVRTTCRTQLLYQAFLSDDFWIAIPQIIIWILLLDVKVCPLAYVCLQLALIIQMNLFLLIFRISVPLFFPESSMSPEMLPILFLAIDWLARIKPVTVIYLHKVYKYLTTSFIFLLGPTLVRLQCCITWNWTFIWDSSNKNVGSL